MWEKIKTIFSLFNIVKKYPFIYDNFNVIYYILKYTKTRIPRPNVPPSTTYRPTLICIDIYTVSSPHFIFFKAVLRKAATFGNYSVRASPKWFSIRHVWSFTTLTCRSQATVPPRHGSFPSLTLFFPFFLSPLPLPCHLHPKKCSLSYANFQNFPRDLYRLSLLLRSDVTFPKAWVDARTKPKSFSCRKFDGKGLLSSLVEDFIFFPEPIVCLCVYESRYHKKIFIFSIENECSLSILLAAQVNAINRRFRGFSLLINLCTR